MEPAEAVALAESALREAVRLVLPQWSQAAGAPKAEDLEWKRAEDVKRRDGTVPPGALLDYTELHHLSSLIRKNWARFKPVFDDLGRTKVLLGVLLDYRNPVCHTRELVAFERDLLSGASGQLRSQVMLYRTRNEPSSAHYPVIESVTDDFGQRLDPSGFLHSWTANHELIRLSIGDRLQFHCVGWDKQERPLTWSLRAGADLFWARPTIIVSGRRTRFTVTVGKEWIGESIGVGISVKSPGPYHRHMPTFADQDMPFTRYDDEVYAFYAVNPPRL